MTDLTDAQWNNIKNYLVGKERKRREYPAKCVS